MFARTDRQTDGQCCNISRPGPSAPREIIKLLGCAKGKPIITTELLEPSRKIFRYLKREMLGGYYICSF